MTLHLPRPRKVRVGAQRFDRHVPGIRYGVLDEIAAYQVRRAQIAIYEELEPVMSELALTPPRFSSLVLIDQNPGVLQSDLARIIGVGRSAMVAIIDELEQHGWLQRQQHQSDARANHLELTPAGHAHLERAVAAVMALDRRWTQQLSPAEKAQLVDLLGRLGPPQEG